ncbi:BatD family protein [Parachlamydia acanthamoebae]|uniref:BatD family protein n=1 Tax=Parachlamydia acanthamoebae TaxID=83552 RepID=UPI000560134E|nr:BatD family protein [Parachlamydia acanthamoebae]
MVRIGFMLLFFFFGHSFCFCAEDVKVTAEIESDHAFAGQPLRGTIMITHDSQETVDAGSFMLNGKTPLKAQFQRDVRMAQGSPLVISIYLFTLDSQDKGLYVLPNIHVTVGGKKYQSALSSYEVHDAHASRPTAVPAKPSSTYEPPSAAPPKSTASTNTNVTPVLKLEAFVQGKSTLFPGERTQLVYRYVFNTDINLTKELVPMLDAVGMRKVGSKQIHDHTEGNFSIREIMQEVEAVKPGKYVYGPSLIEGYAGSERQLLSAPAPIVTVIVNELPQETTPKTFNGAIGDFTYQVKMLTPSTVQVGDKIQLSIQVTGKGDLSTIKLPDLCCQPGFEGLFTQSDLHDSGKIQGDTVSFIAEMRPLSILVHEIPSIEFSSFNPQTKKYVIKRSAPIPLTVTESQPDLQKETQVNAKEAWSPQNAKPHDIEIQGNEPLTRQNLDNRFLATWWSLLLIPLGVGFLLFQIQLKKHLADMQRHSTISQSEQILKEALKNQHQPDLCFALITRALLTRLVEKKKIPTTEVTFGALPREGIVGEVREFLMQVEKMRFSGHPEVSVEEYLTKGKELFSKVE